jgi:hypothetical protein
VLDAPAFDDDEDNDERPSVTIIEERPPLREDTGFVDYGELERLTLDASTAVERAWRALGDVVDAHAAQQAAEHETDADD